MKYIVKTYFKRNYKCVNDIRLMLEAGYTLERIADHENFLIYFYIIPKSVVEDREPQNKQTKKKSVAAKKRKIVDEDSDD
jgi:hypothetical protein